MAARGAATEGRRRVVRPRVAALRTHARTVELPGGPAGASQQWLYTQVHAEVAAAIMCVRVTRNGGTAGLCALPLDCSLPAVPPCCVPSRARRCLSWARWQWTPARGRWSRSTTGWQPCRRRWRRCSTEAAACSRCGATGVRRAGLLTCTCTGSSSCVLPSRSQAARYAVATPRQPVPVLVGGGCLLLRRAAVIHVCACTFDCFGSEIRFKHSNGRQVATLERDEARARGRLAELEARGPGTPQQAKRVSGVGS